MITFSLEPGVFGLPAVALLREERGGTVGGTGAWGRGARMGSRTGAGAGAGSWAAGPAGTGGLTGLAGAGKDAGAW
ncbi:MAG: hypothetical protein HOQ38_03765, partial [Nonomuraea sp.]|nr:hypothetical protein [Nonomuraea sp.]